MRKRETSRSPAEVDSAKRYFARSSPCASSGVNGGHNYSDMLDSRTNANGKHSNFLQGGNVHLLLSDQATMFMLCVIAVRVGRAMLIDHRLINEFDRLVKVYHSS